MGLAISSLMDFQNRFSIIPHEGRLHFSSLLSEPQNIAITEPTATESSIYRFRSMVDKDYKCDLYNSHYCSLENSIIVLELFQLCAKNRCAPFAAYRPIENIEKETHVSAYGSKKEMLIYHFQETKYISRGQFWAKVVALGEGFKALSVKRGDLVGICEDTRWEWMVTCYALWSIGAVVVTFYATLGDDALLYVIQECALKIIVLNGKLVEKVSNILKSGQIEQKYRKSNDHIKNGNINGVSRHERETFSPSFVGSPLTSMTFVYLDDLLCSSLCSLSCLDSSSFNSITPTQWDDSQSIKNERETEEKKKKLRDALQSDNIDNNNTINNNIIVSNGSSEHLSRRDVCQGDLGRDYDNNIFLLKWYELLSSGRDRILMKNNTTTIVGGDCIDSGKHNGKIDAKDEERQWFLLEDIVFSDSCQESNHELKLLSTSPAFVDLSIPTDLAMIMYTSGTTGIPKGVMLSYGNVRTAAFALFNRLNMFFFNGNSMPGKHYMAYLPLAHIFEFATENALGIYGECVLCYGSARTLTNATARPIGDIQEYKPYFFFGVPRVFDAMQKGLKAKLPPFKRSIFDNACATRLYYLTQNKDTLFYNKKIFSKIHQELFGGQLGIICCGAAPLSTKTHDFLRAVSGAIVIQGYGLTETGALATTQIPWDMRNEEVGVLHPCVEMKLRDAEDWTHSHKVINETGEKKTVPRGEVLVRGPFTSMGYYKQEELTKESFLEDGWFTTGDVGELTEDMRNLKIIGRLKVLAKTSRGEYIALENLESLYGTHFLVSPNGVCILAHPQRDYICALILTDEEKVQKFAASFHLASFSSLKHQDGDQKHHSFLSTSGSSSSWIEILKNPAFHEVAAAELRRLAEHKSKAEQVKYVRVLADEWTPENGILTAAQKIKRREIEKRYKDVIDEMFEEK